MNGFHVWGMEDDEELLTEEFCKLQDVIHPSRVCLTCRMNKSHSNKIVPGNDVSNRLSNDSLEVMRAVECKLQVALKRRERCYCN